MMMLEQFTVENFKAFKSLTLDDLGHINIFVGENNVGKTCLLEAMVMSLKIDLLRQQDLGSIRYANFDLPFPLKDSLDYLFYKLNKTVPITFAHRFKNEDSNPLMSPPPIVLQATPFSSPFINVGEGSLYDKNYYSNNQSVLFYQANPLTNEQRKNSNQDLEEIPTKNLVYLRTTSDFRELSEYYYDGCIDNNKEDYIINLLKEAAEDRLTKISYISKSRLRIGLQGLENKYPLSSLGDGFPKFLGLASTLYAEERQYLFIDEPENGFHYKTQTSFWKLLANWSLEGDKQSFIATHSYELISCLNDLLTADPILLERGLKVRVHQLKRDETDSEKITVKTINEEGLDWLLAHEMEIR